MNIIHVIVASCLIASVAGCGNGLLRDESSLKRPYRSITAWSGSESITKSGMTLSSFEILSIILFIPSWSSADTVTTSVCSLSSSGRRALSSPS